MLQDLLVLGGNGLSHDISKWMEDGFDIASDINDFMRDIAAIMDDMFDGE